MNLFFTEPPASAAEFQARAIAYFEGCEEDGKPVTLTGLSLGVGFASRIAMADMAQSGDDKALAESIRRAVTYVESRYEEQLYSSHCAGAVFALRNLGWRDSDTKGERGGGPSVNILVASSEALQAHTENILRLGSKQMVEVENG